MKKTTGVHLSYAAKLSKVWGPPLPYRYVPKRVACRAWLPIATLSIEAAAITLGSDVVFRSEGGDLRYDLVGRGIRSFVLVAARATVIADGQARKSPPN